ncbi:hypothetical protein BVRB_1g011520 [Beta vulgaris subsp. vulgaris]|nr:hypothetical protein BVRB_1g011520 [Beta vulgaris subsp. vulgaris]
MIPSLFRCYRVPFIDFLPSKTLLILLYPPAQRYNLLLFTSFAPYGTPIQYNKGFVFSFLSGVV